MEDDMKRRLSCYGAGVEIKLNNTTFFRELNTVGEVSHEEDATTMRFGQVGRISRVGEVLVIKSGTVVTHHECELRLSNFIAYVNRLLRVEFIAVIDGVVHCLRERHEDIAIMIFTDGIALANIIHQLIDKRNAFGLRGKAN